MWAGRMACDSAGCVAVGRDVWSACLFRTSLVSGRLAEAAASDADGADNNPSRERMADKRMDLEKLGGRTRPET